jgi:hypothetical protein
MSSGWRELAEGRGRSTRKKIRSHAFHIASREDLIRMKEIAARDRRAPGDEQDLEFLKRLHRRDRGPAGQREGRA